MKLTEIFEPETINKSTHKNLKGSYNDVSDKNIIGAGMFSLVSSNKRDPHLISKRHKSPERDGKYTDAFTEYAEIVVRDELWNMIHFPRIYKTITLRDSENKKLRKWKIEKLYSLATLNSKETSSLIERYFGNDANIDSLKIEKPHHMADYLGNKIIDNELDAIKDETLLAACKKLIEIKQELSRVKNVAVFLDLGTGNIMIRRTKYGPEIVFSDPFA